MVVGRAEQRSVVHYVLPLDVMHRALLGTSLLPVAVQLATQYDCVEIAGNTACTMCTAAKFQSSAGSTACLACAEGKYNSATMATSPDDCLSCTITKSLQVPTDHPVFTSRLFRHSIRKWKRSTPSGPPTMAASTAASFNHCKLRLHPLTKRAGKGPGYGPRRGPRRTASQ